MSSDGGGGRSGASRGIQDTNAGDSEACGGDLEEEKNVCVRSHVDKLGHIWCMSQAQLSG